MFQPEINRSILSGKRIRAVVGAALAVSVATLSLTLFGFIRPGDAGQYAGQGYGMFSMNLLSPIDPGNTGSILFKTQPTKIGQTEGFNYFGCGILLMCLSALARRPSIMMRLRSRKAIIGCIIFSLSFLLALSLVATAGNWVLYDIKVSDWIFTRLSAFRASGRLFWPGYYLAMTCIIIACHDAFERSLLIVVTSFVIIQLADVNMLGSAIRNQWSIVQSAGLSQDPSWHNLGRSHRNLVVVPPWQCVAQQGPGANDGWWLFGKLAGDQRMTVNSFYAGRTSPAQISYFCEDQKRQIEREGFQQNSAYVLSIDQAALVVAQAPAHHRCRLLDTVILCTEEKNNPGVDNNIFQKIPSLPLDRVIRFSKNDTESKQIIGTGLSLPEEWGRWMTGPESSMVFKLESLTQAVTVHISVTPFLPLDRTQRLIAKVKDRSLGSWKFSQSSQDDVVFDLRPEDAGDNGIVILEFETPDAVSPYELGLSGDSRKVGIGLIDMKMSYQ